MPTTTISPAATAGPELVNKIVMALFVATVAPSFNPTSPFTLSLLFGAVVPIPTFPLLAIVNLVDALRLTNELDILNELSLGSTPIM
ncbi:MAG: hypothetical protein KFKLKKLM_00944 [Flavobacteriales bacterium]|nr:hypothetical protein [Flavobacteriales bacterium]